MLLDSLEEIFLKHADSDAVIWSGKKFSYGHILREIEYFEEILSEKNFSGDEIVLFSADFSPESIALFLALLKKKLIVALASDSAKEISDNYAGIIGAKSKISFENRKISFEEKNFFLQHELYIILRSLHHAGIIIFTSGSTGQPKAALHDAERFLKKFLRKRHSFRTVAFLRYDHVGGLDTLFYSLFNAGTLIIPEEKNPDKVCQAVEKYSAEVLPVSPSFLSLLLLSRAYERYDLSSLKYISYGAEYMPEALLRKCAEIFPHVTLLQKYGTTETGTLRSKSEGNFSPWVRIGGEEFQTRIVSGKLEIKSDGLMLGYLNAPSPFTSDGWFQTNDIVEEKENFLRIKGRENDYINIGGNKVSVHEVENILLEIDGVFAATVYGEDNAILGTTLAAKIFSDTARDKKLFRENIRLYCAEKLEVYKIPAKIIFADTLEMSERMKKIRNR